MSKHNVKGFLFVITIFLILTYILLSIGVMVKAIEASERSYSELYKESTIELVLGELTPAKITEISNLIMTRAVFKMNKYSISHPIKEGPAEDEYYYIRNAMFEYLKNGAPSADNFDDGIPPDSEYESSMEGWLANLNASLLSIGAYIENYTIYDFKFNQENIKELNYSFKMRISLKDRSGTASLSREYDISGKINITGLVDPAIARESEKHGPRIYRQFFFYDGYSSPSSVSPERIKNIEEGQGWFYGQLTTPSGATLIPQEHRRRYILVGSYDDIKNLGADVYEGFGGYILTNEPEEESCTARGMTYTGERNTFNAIKYSGPNCDIGIDEATRTQKPFVVAPGFSINDAPQCPDLSRGTTERCVLFIAAKDPSEVQSNPQLKLTAPEESTGIFDIEKIRDYVMCGYYIPYGEAPSYLQRLLPNSYNRSGGDLGIETFLIGEYVRPSEYEKYDRLDRKMFNETLMDQFIRGMPGCKDAYMCGISETPTGRFGLSEGSIGEYGLESIDCGEGARCE